MIDPIELVDKKDPEKVIAHACGKCGTVCRNGKDAVEHCEPRLCKCGAVLDRTQAICSACWEKKRKADLQAKIDAAKPISATDYDGPVHWEQGDRYFSDVGEAFEHLADDGVRDAILWPCDKLYLALNACDIIRDALETQEHHDEAEASEKAEKALQDFLDGWNDTFGEEVESWFPRCDEIVEIPQAWWDRHDAGQRND